MATPGEQNIPLSPDTRSPTMDYNRASRRYGPTASSDPVPATASLLGSSSGSRLSAPQSTSTHGTRAGASSASDGWGWNDPEADDYLHNPDPRRDIKNDRGGSIFTLRGIVNIGCLVLLLLCLITLFAGYPIITFYTAKHETNNGGYNLGGTNATGQVPFIPEFPDPIDSTTPDDARTFTGDDGHAYKLVFSDEFTKDGRTFYPGDDPYWTAVDIHYWPTGDYEWYDPSAVTTEGGHLKITMTQEPIHDLNFKSGMLQSWNQMCFQYSYYMEVSVSLPGSNRVGGFWPGVWTMGNLGRPGYGASTDGMWPYTYDSCDTGTLPNQTWVNGTGPAAALDSGSNGGVLSFLPGQRTSACTCPGEDHPGPSNSIGRGVPEIDIIEAQVDLSQFRGEMSQSCQVAPFDDYYQFNNATGVGVRVWDADVIHWNTYLGGVYQQAVSGLAYVPNSVYQLTSAAFNTYGVEVYADPNDRNAGHITWYAGGKKTWTMYPASVGPNPRTDVGQRLISEEPMSMIINFGMSDNFQRVDLANLKWPAHMLVDYVRVYQRDEGRLGCDPSDHPTAKYIQDHLDVYSNPNMTVWSDTTYAWPKNKLVHKC